MPVEVAIGLVTSASIISFAFWRGSTPERSVGAIIAAWLVADPIYHLFSGPAQFRLFDMGHFTLDGLQFLAIAVVALRANRFWPIWASAAQTIAVLGHLIVLTGAVGMQRTYWAMTQLPFYLQLAALLLGTICHHRRSERLGPYRDWRLA